MSYLQTLSRPRRVAMDERTPTGETPEELLRRLLLRTPLTTDSTPTLATPIERPVVQPPVMPDVPTRMSIPPIGNPATDTTVPNTQPIIRPIERITAVNTPVPEPPLSTAPPLARRIITGMNEQPISDPAATPIRMRPRVELGERPVMTGDPMADEEQLQRYNPKDHNGRLKSSLLQALRGFLGGGLPGAIGGGVGALIDPASDEKYQQAIDLQRVGGINDRRMAQQAEQARIGQVQANTDWLRQRPDIERDKQDALTTSRAAQLLEREYSARPTYDPNDPLEAKDPNSLTNRARAANMAFGKKDAKTRPGFTFGYQRYEYGPDGQPRPVFEDTTRKPVPVKLSDGSTVYTTGQGAASNDAMRQGQAATQSRFEQGQAATESRFERGQARASEGDDKALARQEEADRRGAIAQLNLARSKREQAAKARAKGDDDAADQLETDASDIEATAAINFPNVVDVQDSENMWGAMRRTYKIKERAQSASSPYVGRRMSQGQLQKYAKDKGLSVDDARKRVEGLGVMIY